MVYFRFLPDPVFTYVCHVGTSKLLLEIPCTTNSLQDWIDFANGRIEVLYTASSVFFIHLGMVYVDGYAFDISLLDAMKVELNKITLSYNQEVER